MSAFDMNKQAFYEALEGELPVLVDFWAPWCPYCRRIGPAIEALGQQHSGSLIVGKVNVDDEPELEDEQQIELLPTLVLYHEGKALGSIIAPESQAQIEVFIRESLNREAEQAAETGHVHDMVIVGGGPGGYTAALYGARAGLDVVILEKLSAGGQMAQTQQIDNYPGYEQGVDGFELAETMRRQAERFGAKTRYEQVSAMDLRREPKELRVGDKVIYGKTVVLATGASPRELGIAGEKELVGRGVAYCAACDGMAYKGKTVAVVGGGNSAAADALLLSRIAEKVILIHRRDSLRATKVYHEPLMQADNVEICWNSEVGQLVYGERLTGLFLRDVKTGAERQVACDGLFVSVGRAPATELVQGQLELDAGGYVVAGENTRTNIPGVFAVGDVRTTPLRQVVTAVSDGAVAVHSAEEWLAENG